MSISAPPSQRPRGPGGLPAFRVRVGAYDFTTEAENLTFSNADPGGYEAATFDLQAGRADLIYPGDLVRIMDGPSTVWEGRVAEPGKTIKHGWHVSRKVGAASTRVAAEGLGAGTKDNDMSMVYVDRDLGQWQGPTIGRQIAIAGIGALGNMQTGADPNGGSPALVFSATGPWTTAMRADGYYDAGPGNLISKVYATATANSRLSASFSETLYSTTNPDTTTTSLWAISLAASASATQYTTVNPQTRYLFYELFFNGTGGDSAGPYEVYLKNLAVYGNHGLVGRGADPVGFYTSDIALHAAQQAIVAGANMKLGLIDQFIQYIVPHYLQRSPVDHETIISDMAKLAPAHYGVWESSSIFDDIPEFVFRAYGTQADYFVALADCDEVDLSERLANLFNKATITYQDAAGSSYVITVSLPNYLLSRAGINRTQVLDLGLSSSGAAQVFANYVLQILFAQARAAGSVTLPREIRDRNGAMVPSYKLKSGIHRLRVNDLPTRSGLLTSSDTDSFRISRVESNVDTSSGQVTSRVELDAGPNLIETLTARLAIVQSIANF